MIRRILIYGIVLKKKKLRLIAEVKQFCHILAAGNQTKLSHDNVNGILLCSVERSKCSEVSRSTYLKLKRNK